VERAAAQDELDGQTTQHGRTVLRLEIWPHGDWPRVWDGHDVGPSSGEALTRVKELPTVPRHVGTAWKACLQADQMS
jgi:hypothetical protein